MTLGKLLGEAGGTCRRLQTGPAALSEGLRDMTYGGLCSSRASRYAPGSSGAYWQSLALAKSGLLMRAIAIRFVFRRTAAAQGNAVAHLARLAIRPFDRNAPTDPQGAVRGQGDFLGRAGSITSPAML